MRARRWSVDRRLADDRITMLIALGVGDVAAQHDLRRTAVRNFERAAVRSHQVMASARTPASPRAPAWYEANSDWRICNNRTAVQPGRTRPSVSSCRGLSARIGCRQGQVTIWSSQATGARRRHRGGTLRPL